MYSPHAYDATAESGSGFDPTHRESMLQKLLSYGFDVSMQTATIVWEPDGAVDAPTEIRVPARVYPRGVMIECGGCTVEESPGLVRLRTPPPGNPVTVTLRPR